MICTIVGLSEIISDRVTVAMQEREGELGCQSVLDKVSKEAYP